MLRFNYNYFLTSFSEGYNNLFANYSEGIGIHPQIYVWFYIVKLHLETSDVNTDMAAEGNPNLKKYANKHQIHKEHIRTRLMLNLKHAQITLASYLLSFGQNIDNKQTDDMLEDIEDEIEKDTEAEKPIIKQDPGGHSKISKKYVYDYHMINILIQILHYTLLNSGNITISLDNCHAA